MGRQLTQTQDIFFSGRQFVLTPDIRQAAYRYFKSLKQFENINKCVNSKLYLQYVYIYHTMCGSKLILIHGIISQLFRVEMQRHLMIKYAK